MILSGIEYLDEDLELFPDGSVHDAVLVHDTKIQNRLWKGKELIVFFPSGKVRLGCLAEPALIGNIKCASGITYLYEDGSVLNASLDCEQIIDSIYLPPKTRITLGEDGNLLEYSQSLNRDGNYKGFPCVSAFRVWQYADGTPSVVVLSSPFNIAGKLYLRGTELFLDEDGNVLEYRSTDVDSGQQYAQRVFGIYEAPYF